LPYESVREGIGTLAALGAEVEVLGPPDLRAAMAEVAAAMAYLYLSQREREGPAPKAAGG
jgi:hypothetical protein